MSKTPEHPGTPVKKKDQQPGQGSPTEKPGRSRPKEPREPGKEGPDPDKK